MAALAATASGAAGVTASTAATTQFDVQIGDGMDIAIHGENGKGLFTPHIHVYRVTLQALLLRITQ